MNIFGFGQLAIAVDDDCRIIEIGVADAHGGEQYGDMLTGTDATAFVERRKEQSTKFFSKRNAARRRKAKRRAQP